jgi:hypothetical protein
MRYLFFLLVFLVEATIVKAQNREWAFNSTTSSNMKLELGIGYLWSELNGHWSGGTELNLGGIYRSNWAFGVRGSWNKVSTSKTTLDELNELKEIDISLISGLAYLGYIHQAEELIHFRGELGLGGGIWKQEKKMVDSGLNKDSSRPVVLFHPRLGMEVNLTQWMSLSTWLGYQFIGGKAVENGFKADSPHALISLRFGNF